MSRGAGIDERKLKAQNYELETITQKMWSLSDTFITLSVPVQPNRTDMGMSKGIRGREKYDI
jgi:hypothetical protein